MNNIRKILPMVMIVLTVSVTACSESLKKSIGAVKETPDEFIVRPATENLEYPTSKDALPNPVRSKADSDDIRAQLEEELYYERLKREKEEEDWRLQMQKKIKKAVGSN